jgi:hypothetical protein
MGLLALNRYWTYRPSKEVSYPDKFNGLEFMNTTREG